MLDMTITEPYMYSSIRLIISMEKNQILAMLPSFFMRHFQLCLCHCVCVAFHSTSQHPVTAAPMILPHLQSFCIWSGMENKALSFQINVIATNKPGGCHFGQHGRKIPLWPTRHNDTITSNWPEERHCCKQTAERWDDVDLVKSEVTMVHIKAIRRLGDVMDWQN
jgi:hypothetical protein